MGGGKIFWGTLRGGQFFLGCKRGGPKFFLGVQEGGPEFFFAPSARFPILSLSKNFPRLRRNFSYTYTIIISQYIFNHTPGLKGHGYIAREVGCLELQQGGDQIFFSKGKGGGKISYGHAPSLFINMCCTTYLYYRVMLI